MTSQDTTYRIKGGRVGVLLIHGMCGTPTEMRYVANGLARAGYTVHCPQISGQCGSAANVKASTWQDWYACAERALDELRLECDVVIVGGLSSGAVISLLLAANRPHDVQGIALFAPTLWLNGWIVPWRMSSMYATEFLPLCANPPNKYLSQSTDHIIPVYELGLQAIPGAGEGVCDKFVDWDRRTKAIAGAGLPADGRPRASPSTVRFATSPDRTAC